MGRGGNGQAVRARTRDGAAARDQRARAVSESMNWDGWTKEGRDWGWGVGRGVFASSRRLYAMPRGHR